MKLGQTELSNLKKHSINNKDLVELIHHGCNRTTNQESSRQIKGNHVNKRKQVCIKN